jgi:ribose 1,5-bisphosphokinase PhnN
VSPILLALDSAPGSEHTTAQWAIFFAHNRTKADAEISTQIGYDTYGVAAKVACRIGHADAPIGNESRKYLPRFGLHIDIRFYRHVPTHGGCDSR